MYEEILKLATYCEEIGVEIEQHKWLDGTALCFNNGGDVVQHMSSYGNRRGCVEFGGTGFPGVDFTGTSLEKAKDFVKKNKDVLNTEKGGDEK